MRKRPCLLFACIFLTGLAFQRYQWSILWVIPMIFLAMEIYHGVKTFDVFKSSKNASDEQRNVAAGFVCGATYRIFGRMAGRSVLLLSAFFLGMWHMKTEEDFRNAYMSKIEDGSSAVVWGEIIKIEKTDYGSRLILSDSYVSLQEANVPCNEVMVYVSSDHFRVGQIYQIKGQFHLFERAGNFGNFDSALFYQSQKIDFSVYEEESILLSSNENSIRDSLLELKMRMEEVYRCSLEEGAAGFYMGMMLGDKSLLQDRTKDLFALGGISHILAISGLHMSIIGRGFYKQLRKHRIGFLTAGVLAGILLFAYCFMVGNGVSAIRAVGMMLIYFLGQWLGRSYDMLNALGAMVIYLLWDNPFLLEYSGFQFSIAALVGVGFVGQILSESVQSEQCMRKSIGQKLASNIWMSIGITLSTLPIVAYCYFEIPLYSPVVNSIVLPILTPIFALALFGALIGCIVPFAGNLLLIPCGWLFSFYEWICQFVERLPCASVITGMPELKTMVLYYGVLLCGCLLVRCMNSRKKAIQDNGDWDKVCGQEDSIGRIRQFKRVKFVKKYLLQAVLAAACVFIILYPKAAQSEVVFLDVGQGDGIYISSEDGTTFFIDGGSSDVNQVGTYRILPFLKAYGVKQMDYWFVSHADSDHISGLLEVMEEGYEIGCLVISDKMPMDENGQELLEEAKKQGIEVIYMKAGEQISSEHIQISCLYPWAETEDKNEQSMVLLLEFLDEERNSIFRGMFTGDISSEGEKMLLEKGVLADVNLYKAAHHGSKYSNSSEFLEVIQPEFCVISCGKDNSYGHPHVETIERLEGVESEVLYTMESGQVTVKIQNNGIEIFIRNFIAEYTFF